MYANKIGALIIAVIAQAAWAQSANSMSTATPAPTVSIGDLARAQARAIEGEMADLLSRLKTTQPAAAAPAVAAPQPAAASAPAQAQKRDEAQGVRVAPAAPPKRTHFAFLGLYGTEGNVTLEFELPDGQIVQRKSGDRIGQHRVEVQPSGRVLLVGQTTRVVRPGDRFN